MIGGVVKKLLAVQAVVVLATLWQPSVAARATSAQVTKSVVSFVSGPRVLQGYLYVPAGKGPFPAMLWNHGSEAKPTDQPDLADYYTRAGYVFFVPHRRGQGLSPGPYIMDQIYPLFTEPAAPYGQGLEVVRLLEEQNDDVVAALNWLKKQPFVDRSRLFMSGASFGGIQTLLAAEKGLGLRGAIPFAPGAMSWENAQLADRLIDATYRAKVPLFLIQASNDFGLGPSYVLTPIIAGRGGPNRAKLYPDFGAHDDHRSGHGRFAIRPGGIQIWGSDVARFMHDCLEAKQ